VVSARSHRWLRRRFAELAQLRATARASGTSIISALPKYARLVLAESYSPAEVFMLGFVGQASPVAEANFISKERMLAVQQRVNPRDCFDFTEDKLVFFARCVEHGLPTPRVRAAFSTEPCQAGSVPVAHDGAQLAAILAADEPWDLVFKPVAGVHGHGVRILRLDHGTFTDSNGARYTADDLVALVAQSDYRSWLAQDRLYPHRALAALSGSPFLQTARVVSCVDRNGSVRVPIAWLRLIAGAGPFDNFNFGASGNMVATVDLATGQIDHVLAPGEPGRGVVEAWRHSATGALFADFTLPFATEIRDLVVRAARAFTPLRTIGWDVAITETGPSLIEGNVTWDPLPTKRNLRIIAESLQ
jgi:hypothetical protein